jgi:hypothetical protein
LTDQLEFYLKSKKDSQEFCTERRKQIFSDLTKEYNPFISEADAFGYTLQVPRIINWGYDTGPDGTFDTHTEEHSRTHLSLILEELDKYKDVPNFFKGQSKQSYFESHVKKDGLELEFVPVSFKLRELRKGGKRKSKTPRNPKKMRKSRKTRKGK